MATINTINVIVLQGGVIESVKSFTNDDDGVKESEEYFSRVVRQELDIDDEQLTEDDLYDAITDGYYETYNVEIHIVHSSGV